MGFSHRQRRIVLSLLFLLFAACAEPEAITLSQPTAQRPFDFYETDGDFYSPSQGDCDSSDEDVNPAAEELCDGFDNNCDGFIDEGVVTTFYRDDDGDGWGSDERTLDACLTPEGYCETPGDCDDDDATVYPGSGCP